MDAVLRAKVFVAAPLVGAIRAFITRRPKRTGPRSRNKETPLPSRPQSILRNVIYRNKQQKTRRANNCAGFVFGNAGH